MSDHKCRFGKWNDECEHSCDRCDKKQCDVLRAENKLLRELLHEVAISGLEMEDDPRMHYLTVQIDRVTWNQIQEVAK